MRTSEQIQTEIQNNLGFLPPFFKPAFQNPQVLENLWQQTLFAYILNPFSPLFKEKLSAYLSRYCPVSYCLVCHSCSLRPLGMNGREVLQLLSSPAPTAIEIDFHLNVLRRHKSELNVLSNLNSVIEESLLRCAIFFSKEHDLAVNCRDQLREILGYENYQHLITFVAYIKTCHEWMEAHPEVSYEADKRAIDYLASLLEEEPALADFFHNHVKKVEGEQLAKSDRTKNPEQQRQSQLLAENSRLVQAVNSASVGIIITDPHQSDHPIIYSNPAFSQITGYQPDEIIGRNCRFLQGSFTDPKTVEVLRQAIAEAREVKATLLNYRKDGQPFWNELKISPVFSDMGDLLYFVGFQTDITEKIQLEAQVFRAQRLESVGNLAFGMAHNLNNALTPVMMAVDILETKIQDEQNQNLLKTVTVNKVGLFLRMNETNNQNMRREFASREDLIKYVREQFPTAIKCDRHISLILG